MSDDDCKINRNVPFSYAIFYIPCEGGDGVQIKKQMVSSKKTVFLGVNGRKYITIHETGNTKKGAGAQAHANLQTNGFSASWHWQVDDQMAIQSYPHTVQCWHAGDGRGTGNLQSIAIEICVNADGNYEKAVRNAITLTKMIMQEEGIPANNVVQHHHWSGKNCPSRLRSGKIGMSWTVFQQHLQITRNTLRFSNTGEAVKDLQKKLNQIGFNLVVDGAFGPKTREAVEMFQRNHALEIDGLVGPKTWAALNGELVK